MDIRPEFIDHIKEFLTNRTPTAGENLCVKPTPELAVYELPDICLPRANPDSIKNIQVIDKDYEEAGFPTSPDWTYQAHVLNWTSQLLKLIERNADHLAYMELLREGKMIPISVARHRVAECFNVINAASCLQVGFLVTHPDTNPNPAFGSSFGVCNILIEETTAIHDLVRQIMVCIYTRCLVRLIVKTRCYFTALQALYLLDLMLQAGAMVPIEIQVFILRLGDAIEKNRFQPAYLPKKKAKHQCVVAVVELGADTWRASGMILESFFLDGYPNMAILCEEAAFPDFVLRIQDYYAHNITIGHRINPCSKVTQNFNQTIAVDLTGVNPDAIYNMPGPCINIFQWRSREDLYALVSRSFKKLPYMMIFSDDLLKCKTISLHIQSTREFWLNHAPRTLAAKNFNEDVYRFYRHSVQEDMDTLYSIARRQMEPSFKEVEGKLAEFRLKSPAARTRYVMERYLNMIEASKDLRVAPTIGECLARLKRFENVHGARTAHLEIGTPAEKGTLIEIDNEPNNIAMVYVREEDDLPPRSKANLLEWIFKNILLGIGVMLITPKKLFDFEWIAEEEMGEEERCIFPFRLCAINIPNIVPPGVRKYVGSRGSDMVSEKRCPPHYYGLIYDSTFSDEILDAVTVALGIKRTYHLSPLTHRNTPATDQPSSSRKASHRRSSST